MEKYTGPAFYQTKTKVAGENNRFKAKHETQRDKRVATNLTRKTAYNNSRGFHPRTFPLFRQQGPVVDLKAKYQKLSQQLKKAKTDFILFQDESIASQQELELFDLRQPVVDFETPSKVTTPVKQAEMEAAVVEASPAKAVEDSSEAVEVFEPHELSEQPLTQTETETVADSQPKAAQVAAVIEEAAKKEEPVVEFEKVQEKQPVKTGDDKQPLATTKPVVQMPTQPEPTSIISDVSGEAKQAAGGYERPALTLLPAPISENTEQVTTWVSEQATKLDETLKSFRVDAQVVNWTIGPAVVQFEVKLGRGVKVSKITNLTDDLQLALAVRDVRIEAPIPGKSSVGIEIPNRYARPVNLAEVLGSQAFLEAKSPLTVALGVDLFGNPQVTDLQKMPHGLIAGATGSGKSVFINSMLVSLLYKASPAEVKLILIDPKAVEMAPYQGIPHLLAPVISDAQAAAAALKWVVAEMERRYELLVAAGVRNIEGFNTKAEESAQYGLKLPYIVVVIDELADLMLVASSEVQDYIARITAKARAAGIHLIIATQRPSVDVVTGTIKNNIPTRIAFMVSSQVDSRTIIDTAGAERLLGRGDMLYLGNGSSQPVRLQGTYIGDEIDQVTDFVRSQGQPKYAFDPENLKKKLTEDEKQDKLFPRILDYIVNEEAISTSKLQREFSIGFNRAAGIIDQLEEKQYISRSNGSKPRKVFLTQEGLNKLRAQG
ncbi:DNA translocase FtsK [Ligilactobacillus agilis]|uniref:DNA translocase FtsK n=1 Tax=Ligilactobacillus agilis TaxID=1601 RepID=UPI001D6E7B3A|nr:DNA translocase FtsK [Ligilactobacillus agilis]HJG05329.1 DNA translocase FtsK [Ligilactobacillus agilis]